MAALANGEKLALILRETIVGTVRRDGPDLSARQFACFLIVHLDDAPHTVRGLAARLSVSKPAITRSIDRLAELGLAKRGPDPRDRRSVLILRTRKGNDFMADIRNLLNGTPTEPPPPRGRRPKLVPPT
jgi:DNA-binding MarR family transcriptional regulator